MDTHEAERVRQARLQAAPEFVATQERLRAAAERMGWRFRPAEPFECARADCGDSWISLCVYPDHSIRARKWRDARMDGVLAEPLFTKADDAPDFHAWMLDLCVLPGRLRPCDKECSEPDNITVSGTADGPGMRVPGR